MTVQITNTAERQTSECLRRWFRIG